jgi:hypothetical protein
MPYSDQEIADYAHELEARGAPVEKIRAFVSSAKAEQGSSAPSDADLRAQLKQAGPGPGAEAPIMRTPSVAEPDAFQKFNAVKPTPDQFENMGLRAGGPAAGQAIGAFGGPFSPATVPIGGAIGGMAGEYGAQRREGGPLRFGAILGAGVVGAIPGASMATAGPRAMVREGAKYAAGNLAGKAVETEFDQGRLPTFSEAGLALGTGAAAPVISKALDGGAFSASVKAEASRGAPLKRTIDAGREAGYVFTPQSVNKEGSAVGDIVDQVAGGPAVAAKVAVVNQKATNAQARQYAGLAADAGLDDKAISQAINRESKPFAELAQVSPQASVQLEGVKQARADAKAIWKQYDAKADAGIASPELRDAAKYQEGLADLYEQELEKEARRVGRPELVDQMREARKNLAKIHMVDRALNPSAGDVSAHAFGRALDDGVKLTDEALTIASMAKAFPHLTRDAAKIADTASGKIPVIESLVKRGLLSDTFQSKIAKPFYGVDRPDMAANLAKFGTLAAGRNSQQDPNNIPVFLRR